MTDEIESLFEAPEPSAATRKGAFELLGDFAGLADRDAVDAWVEDVRALAGTRESKGYCGRLEAAANNYHTNRGQSHSAKSCAAKWCIPILQVVRDA